MGWRRLFGLFTALTVLAAAASGPARDLAALPSRVEVFVGQSHALPLGLARGFSVRVDAPTLRLNGRPARPAWERLSTDRLAIQPTAAGSYHLDLRLLGLIPLRHVTIQALPPLDVVPGGQAIGVLLNSSGVLVVGESTLNTPGGQQQSPARAAGLEIGDVITRVDDVAVRDREAVGRLIDQDGRAGGSVLLTVLRDGQTLSLRVHPLMDRELGRYLIGAWVRDGAAGIGTLTFYAPSQQMFGALGHVVADGGTGKPYPISDGRIVPALVSGLSRGRPGTPGEKLGSFLPEAQPWGQISLNTPVGIFGRLLARPSQSLYPAELPLATVDQVHTGPAQLLTVLTGRRVEAFAVEIERVFPQDRASGHGLVLRVTDQQLLRATGGIVQGMSGSPVIQDGRLAGAVTHVFVDDPTRGYGVFAIWMAEAAGLEPS